MAFSGFATLANAFCLVVVPPVLKPNNYPHTTLLIGLFYVDEYVMHAPPSLHNYSVAILSKMYPQILLWFEVTVASVVGVKR